MSKQLNKRKITVDSSVKAPEAARPSVFERLGTKKAAVKKAGEREHCRQWAAHGVCAYGKGCKFAATHTLVSPSKARAAGKEDVGVARLHSTVVRADELDTWDQSDLEYADTDVLEKRRQQLQRELELQMKMESTKTERPKLKKKPATSSSSSRSSSSTTASSSSSLGSSSSSSSARDRKKGKKGKLKRAHSSSSSDDETPSKKKKKESSKVKSTSVKKAISKKDDRKKQDSAPKKKVLLKLTLTNKKSVSPVKKTSGTPPISKTAAKNYRKSKSPARKEKNRSNSREKERDRREREKDRDKDRDRRAKSRSLTRKGRSRSPRRSRERRKDSPDRSRPVSPKKPRRDASTDKPRKSPIKDRSRRDDKDRSLDRRKDDKDRHERDKPNSRARDRGKDKRDTSKRGRDRREADRGLEKPSKPMERLLPRPEERMAALAAITNRNLEPEKALAVSKDRQEPDRGRKQDRIDQDRRERSSKRDRSIDRDHVDYERGGDRGYDRGHSIDRNYERGEHYEDLPREGDNRSPGYGRERHYDPGYDIPGHPRYPEDEDRYGDLDRRDIGFDERRRRERSWEGSVERERQYHHKEWEGEEFRGPEWGRERHWHHREQQLGEWTDKEGEMEPGWHHRGHPPPGAHRPRHEEGYNRRLDPRDGKRRPAPCRPDVAPCRPEVVPSPGVKPEPPAPSAEPAERVPEPEDLPIPDDLSEISDDPDDILNRDDMVEKSDCESQAEPTSEGKVKIESQDTQRSAQDSEGVSPGGVKTERGEGKEDEEEKLDFEDVSEGELEEERARAGLGDALGVDWASLVAEVRRGRERGESAGAQARWRPRAALRAIAIHLPPEEGESKPEGQEESEKPLHPVPSIQVSMERRLRQRAALLGSGCEIARALSARRDLALRRHLCLLPPSERGSAQRSNSQPHLFLAARALLLGA